MVARLARRHGTNPKMASESYYGEKDTDASKLA